MLIEQLAEKKSLSIIGMEKNTGKTTLLNSIIKGYGTQKKLALTSIGYDGEEIDQVTSTSKPRIFIYEGTLIATARSLLKKCDCVKEILQVFDIHTAMGEVIFFRAKSDGYVELGGPSMIEDLRKLKKSIEEIDPEAQLIIDGALSRKSMAGHRLCEASLLCSGAALNGSLNEVVQKTIFTVKLLTKPQCGGSLLPKIKKIFNTSDFVVFDANKNILYNDYCDIPKAENISAIAVKGLITSKKINQLLQRDFFKDLDLICEDGTRLFIDYKTHTILEKKKILIKVLYPIELLGIALNYTSPDGNNFDKKLFFESMRSKSTLPILDTRTLDETQ